MHSEAYPTVRQNPIRTASIDIEEVGADDDDDDDDDDADSFLFSLLSLYWSCSNTDQG